MKKLKIILLTILVFPIMDGCKIMTSDVFLDEHPDASEATARFEGFRPLDPAYCLIIDSLAQYPHLIGYTKPVVDKGDDAYVGLCFKAYYDANNIKDYEFWVCMDELILPEGASFLGYTPARLTKAFQSQGYAFVKYYLTDAHDSNGKRVKYAREEQLPLSFLDQLKRYKQTDQEIEVKVYTNPINPQRPICLIDRESLGRPYSYNRANNIPRVSFY